MSTYTTRLVFLLMVLFSLASTIPLQNCVTAQDQQTEDGQVDANENEQNTPTVIQFVFTSANNISIEATINGTDEVKLMFHTAVNGISLTQEATQKTKSVVFDEAHDVESWGGTSSARRSAKNSLSIGELSWQDLPIWESLHSGPETDGKFGPNLFEGNIIEINFDSNILTLHPSLPEAATQYNQLSIEIVHGSWYVEGALKFDGKTFPNKFMVHSGFGGTALLDDQFVAANKLSEKLETVSESELKDSYGNTIKTKKILAPTFSLGGTEFSDVPVGIFEGAIGQQKVSILGSEFLRRFNWFVDMESAKIYLKPNSLTDLEFPG